MALAIAADPDLLIPDDLTAGLDVVARREFLVSLIPFIERDGRTIFLYLLDLRTRTARVTFDSPEMLASLSVPLEPPSQDAGQPSRGRSRWCGRQGNCTG